MNKSIYYSLVVAFAGFLFGFDTVVISGANLQIKVLWNTSAWFHGTFIMSMALWGTVVGALLGGYPTNSWGRKKTLIWIGVFFSISALGSALASNPYIFSFFRFIGGLAVGVSSIAAPAYISEITSSKNRGKLGALYQTNIVFGILIAFISNYALDGVGGENDWRFMLGVETIPAVIFTFFAMGISESPRWLLLKSKRENAIKVLNETMNEISARSIVETWAKENNQLNKNSTKLFQRRYKKPLLLAFLIAFFNQLSGINFILYYAPEILEKAGFGSSDSLLSSVLIGLVNLIFTLMGMYLIDRFGRKKLMYIGSFGYIISLILVSYGFFTDASSLFKLVFILVFIASHAIGQGAVIWVFISEIFPTQVRSYGQAWGSSVHWVFAALITLFGSVLISAFDPWIAFAFFGGFMILQLLFVHFLMPETKGKSLEELENLLDTNS